MDSSTVARNQWGTSRIIDGTLDSYIFSEDSDFFVEKRVDVPHHNLHSYYP